MAETLHNRISALTKEFGFFEVLDSLADIARLYSVDAQLSEKPRQVESWRQVTQKLNQITEQHKGGR